MVSTAIPSTKALTLFAKNGGHIRDVAFDKKGSTRVQTIYAMSHVTFYFFTMFPRHFL